MNRGLLLLYAAIGLAPLASSLLRSVVQTHRLGPGPASLPGTVPLGQPHGRRAYLRWAVVGGLAVAVAEVGLAGVRFFWPNRTEAFGGLIVAATRNTLPPVGGPPLRNQAGRFYLIRNEEGLLAFSWKCTHLGCTVPWNSAEGQFHCPCHESQFNRRGELVDGPAPRPLDLMPIIVQDDSIIVDTGTIIRRSGYDPRQVTPIG